MSERAIVIGGGIVGTSIAYHLVRSGVETLQFDRNDRGQATAAGAGVVSPLTSDMKHELWLTLAHAAHQDFPALVDDLGIEPGEEVYALSSLLIVALDPEGRTALADLKRIISDRLKSFGIGETAVAEISAVEAEVLFPPLGPVNAALHFKEAARLDGGALNEALRVAAIDAGLQLRMEAVETVRAGTSSLTIQAGGSQYTCGKLALAAGAWTASLASQLGARLDVEPQRGQILHLKLSGVETSGWPMVRGFSGHYIVPRPGGRVVVGATRENGSGFSPSLTVDGIREILAEGLRMAPGLRLAEVEDFKVGLRPLSTDGLPVLGPLPDDERIFVATGHGPTGLSLGPYSGKLIAGWMSGEPPAVDLAAFSPARFQA